MQQPSLSNHQITRQTLGYAISQPPSEIYQRIRTSMDGDASARLHRSVEQHIQSGLVLRAGGSPLKPEQDLSLSLISTGIKDIELILRSQYDTVADITPDHARQIATEPTTLRSIAKLALRSQDSITHLLHFNDRDANYYLNEDQTAIYTRDSLAMNRHDGCPFAGNEGVVRPSPLFNRFVVWSGELTLLHYFKE